MKEKKNFAKVNTPEVAAAIIEKVKGSCSQSAPLMEGSCDAPDDFEAPVIKIVKVEQLEVNGETEENMMFFVGKMFAVKEQLKVLFDIKYGEIVFQGKNKTVWYAKITDNSEDPTSPASWHGSLASVWMWRSSTCARKSTVLPTPVFF